MKRALLSFICALASLGLVGCAALISPFCLYEVNAIESMLVEVTELLAARDWEQLVTSYERPELARRVIDECQELYGCIPICLELTELQVTTLQPDRATVRTVVIAARAEKPEKPIASTAVEIILIKRDGRWIIRDVIKPKINKWKGLYSCVS